VRSKVVLFRSLLTRIDAWNAQEPWCKLGETSTHNTRTLIYCHTEQTLTGLVFDEDDGVMKYARIEIAY
jgi:hypothetical protein